MSILNFDARQVAPQQAFEPIPAGWYNMQIIASETKPTSDQQGAYLQLTLKVLDGSHVNRQVIARLNIKNKNPTAQEIAWQQLSAICHAVGVMQVQDSQMLHGRPMQVRVSVKAASGDYDANNEVKAFRSISGTAAPVGGPAPSAGGAPAPTWAGQGAPNPVTAVVQQAAIETPANTPAPFQQGETQAPSHTQPDATATAAAGYPGAATNVGNVATQQPAPTNDAAPGVIPDWAKPAQ